MEEGTTLYRTTPVQVSGLAGVESIAAGGNHSLAVKSDDTHWAWGNDEFGQLGLGQIFETSIPIQSQIYEDTRIEFLNDVVFAKIPFWGSQSITVETQVLDAYGNVIENADIIYSLAAPYPGVSIDGSTGAVTVTWQAQEGAVQIIAAYGELSCTATLNLRREIPGNELIIMAERNSKYLVSLNVGNLTGFGPILTLVYDPSILQLSDLCALTYDKELSVGVIPGTNITVTSFEPGEITFAVDRMIPQTKVWSGVLNIFEFTAIGTGSTTVRIQ